MNTERFVQYGLDDYSLALTSMENLSIDKILFKVENSLSSLKASVEDSSQAFNETAKVDESSFFSKVKEMFKKIGQFFAKIFEAIVSYVKNLSFMKERMIQRDSANLAKLKAVSSKEDFGLKNPLNINVNGKLTSISKIVSKNDINNKTIHDIGPDIIKFYNDLEQANKIVTTKTEQSLQVTDKVTKTAGNPVGLRDLVKKALYIQDIRINNVLTIKYKEDTNTHELAYDIIESFDVQYEPLNLVLANNAEVSSCIKSTIDTATHVIEKEKIIVKEMKNINAKLSAIATQMHQLAFVDFAVKNHREIQENVKPLYAEMVSSLRYMLHNCSLLLKAVLKADKYYSGSYSSFLNNFTKAVA